MLIIVAPKLINLVKIALCFNLYQNRFQLRLLKYVTFGDLIYDKNIVTLNCAT